MRSISVSSRPSVRPATCPSEATLTSLRIATSVTGTGSPASASSAARASRCVLRSASRHRAAPRDDRSRSPRLRMVMTGMSAAVVASTTKSTSARFSAPIPSADTDCVTRSAEPSRPKSSRRRATVRSMTGRMASAAGPVTMNEYSEVCSRCRRRFSIACEPNIISGISSSGSTTDSSSVRRSLRSIRISWPTSVRTTSVSSVTIALRRRAAADRAGRNARRCPRGSGGRSPPAARPAWRTRGSAPRG